MKASAAIVIAYSAGFAAALWSVPQPLPVIKEKPVYVGVSVVPRGSGQQIKKLLTDRIEPTVTEIALAKTPAETEFVRQVVPRVKPLPVKHTEQQVRVAKRLPCKPGRTRNAQGHCGRWGNS